MVQQKWECRAWAEVGRTSSPLTQSWHYDHIGRNTELYTDSDSLWMCPKERGQRGRLCLRMARLAAPTCSLLSSRQH